jgi:hypothetical protein
MTAQQAAWRKSEAYDENRHSMETLSLFADDRAYGPETPWRHLVLWRALCQPQPLIYTPPADPGRLHDFEGPHPLRVQTLYHPKQPLFLVPPLPSDFLLISNAVNDLPAGVRGLMCSIGVQHAGAITPRAGFSGGVEWPAAFEVFLSCGSDKPILQNSLVARRPVGT